MPETQQDTTDDEDIQKEAEKIRKAAVFVSRAKRRRMALDRLVEGPTTATGVAGDRAVGASAAADGLDELLGHSLVEVLIDDDENGRIYGITPDGEQAVYRLQEDASI